MFPSVPVTMIGILLIGVIKLLVQWNVKANWKTIPIYNCHLVQVVKNYNPMIL